MSECLPNIIQRMNHKDLTVNGLQMQVQQLPFLMPLKDADVLFRLIIFKTGLLMIPSGKLLGSKIGISGQFKSPV